MRITVVLALLVSTCTCVPDSVGTSFIFGFLRDADVTNQQLSVTVLNGNDQDCQFILTYRDDYDEKINPLKNATPTVPSMGMVEIPVPSWYGWQYESPGIQVESGPNQLLIATSSCPVTVIASNFDKSTHQGDSFLVLPTSWGQSGKVFTFTLPPSNNDAVNPGYQHISIIPTRTDVTGTLTVLGSSPLPFTAKFGDQPTTYFARKTPQNEPHTYHIQADGPILLVAGTTCAGNYLACDHATFMPQPLPTPVCSEIPVLYDDHPAYTMNTNAFYLDVPETCSRTQNIVAYGNRGLLWKNLTISVDKQPALVVFDETFGGAVNLQAETAALHVTRYYDQSRSAKQGAFIDSVASISQFITENSTFYTRNDNDMLEVVCDIGFCPFATVDGKALMSHDKNFTTTGSIHGQNFYTISVTIPNKGFHSIQSTKTGMYSYYVLGQTANATYGYMGAINMPKVVPLPTTTAGPTTLSTSTVSTASPPTAPVVATSTAGQTPPTTTPSLTPTVAPTLTTSAASTTGAPISTSTVQINTVTSMVTSTTPHAATTISVSSSAVPSSATSSIVTMLSSTISVGLTSTLPTPSVLSTSSSPTFAPSTVGGITSSATLSTSATQVVSSTVPVVVTSTTARAAASTSASIPPTAAPISSVAPTTTSHFTTTEVLIPTTVQPSTAAAALTSALATSVPLTTANAPTLSTSTVIEATSTAQLTTTPKNQLSTSPPQAVTTAGTTSPSATAATPTLPPPAPSTTMSPPPVKRTTVGSPTPKPTVTEQPEPSTTPAPAHPETTTTPSQPPQPGTSTTSQPPQPAKSTTSQPPQPAKSTTATTQQPPQPGKSTTTQAPLSKTSPTVPQPGMSSTEISPSSTTHKLGRPLSVHCSLLVALFAAFLTL